MLAIESQIPVVLIDNIGHPVGQVWGVEFGSIATIRKNQALFSGDLCGMDWIRSVLLQKIANQRALLLRLMEGDIPVEALPKLERAAKAIGVVALNFENWSPDDPQLLDATAATFRGWEGTATRFYFRGIATVLPEKYEFAGRSKRPAYDPFNALLYCYGFLYALSELALMKAGLAPCNRRVVLL